MSTAPARIAPGDRDDIGRINWEVARVSGKVAGTGPPNLFLTLGRHRPLFRGWLRFAGRLMPGGKLARRETELVILRVAHLAGCSYEFDHHVALGRRAGVRAADVDRLLVGPEAPGWTTREQVILAAVDQLHYHRDVTDDAWVALRRELSEVEAIELILLVGHYEMLATAIGTLRIQPDEHRSRPGRLGRRKRR